MHPGGVYGANVDGSVTFLLNEIDEYLLARMVSINDENRARLEMLMEEVFPGRRVGSLVWRTRDSTSAKLSNFSDVHEHVLIYANPNFSFNGRDKTQKKYKNPDNDPRGPWNGDPLTLAFDRFQRKNLYYLWLQPLIGRRH